MRDRALALWLLLVTGCAGSSDRPAASPASPGVAVDAAPAGAPPPPSVVVATAGDARELLATNDVAAAKTVSDVPHEATMLVYTANITMSVYQVEPRLGEVDTIARSDGGYLSNRQDTSITVRVPRDKFDDAVARIEKLGDVTHQDIKAQDVTDEFVDLAARLKNAYAVRDRLTELMTKADVKDALEIEKELGRVTEDIERMEGRMKLLRDQIAFSTITVTFSALAPQTVHDSSLLAPFPWLQDLGLRSLLDVGEKP